MPSLYFKELVLHKPSHPSGRNKKRNIPIQDIMQGPAAEKIDSQRLALRKALKRARQERDLRQVEIAERLNVPQSFVSKYEAGTRTLDFIETLQVCRALGITLENLLVLFDFEQHGDTGK